MAVKEAICGIYKITSPSDKIYIGQSLNCVRRGNNYKNGLCHNQRKLHFSILKYGWKKHKFEIIHICEPNELDNLERYYIELYNSFNSKYGLNLMTGGNKTGKPSKETLELRSKSLKKNWEIRRLEGRDKLSPESIILISESRKKTWEKQKKDIKWFSPEEIKKRSDKIRNRKRSAVPAEGRNNMMTGWKRYKSSDDYNSEEAREKRRIINLGKEPWNKGSKGVMKAWNKGLSCSESQRTKNSESGKKDWERRRASGELFWSKETIEKRRLALVRYYANKKRSS